MLQAGVKLRINASDFVRIDKYAPKAGVKLQSESFYQVSGAASRLPAVGFSTVLRMDTMRALQSGRTRIETPLLFES